MVKKTLLGLAAVVLLTACTKLDLTGLVMPASTEADQRVKQSLGMGLKNSPANIVATTDNYRLYVCSDVHTEEFPRRYNEFLRRQRADSTALFALQLGDLSNRQGALYNAAKTMRYDSIRDRHDTPVYSIVGNHDLFFNQWDDFKQLFGASTYVFTVTTPHYRDLYIMLDSGGGCHGRTQMNWLRGILANRDSYRHCIVGSHVNIFRTDMSQFVSGNLPLEETYELMDLLASHHVDLYLQGHDHHRCETLYGGVHYITLDCLKDGADYASYMVIDAGDGLAWNFHDDI